MNRATTSNIALILSADASPNFCTYEPMIPLSSLNCLSLKASNWLLTDATAPTGSAVFRVEAASRSSCTFLRSRYIFAAILYWLFKGKMLQGYS